MPGATTKIGWKTMDKLYSGKTFRARSNGKQETRHVFDVTLGGDVWCRIGDKRIGRGIKRKISQSAWMAWAEGAKIV